MELIEEGQNVFRIIYKAGDISSRHLAMFQSLVRLQVEDTVSSYNLLIKRAKYVCFSIKLEIKRGGGATINCNNETPSRNNH